MPLHPTEHHAREPNHVGQAVTNLPFLDVASISITSYGLTLWFFSTGRQSGTQEPHHREAKNPFPNNASDSHKKLAAQPSSAHDSTCNPSTTFSSGAAKNLNAKEARKREPSSNPMAEVHAELYRKRQLTYYRYWVQQQ